MPGRDRCPECGGRYIVRRIKRSEARRRAGPKVIAALTLCTGIAAVVAVIIKIHPSSRSALGTLFGGAFTIIPFACCLVIGLLVNMWFGRTIALAAVLGGLIGAVYVTTTLLRVDLASDAQAAVAIIMVPLLGGPLFVAGGMLIGALCGAAFVAVTRTIGPD